MRSLKITLLLAVLFIALTGLTNTEENSQSSINEIETINVDDNKYQLVERPKKNKKPPQA